MMGPLKGATGKNRVWFQELQLAAQHGSEPKVLNRALGLLDGFRTRSGRFSFRLAAEAGPKGRAAE